MIQIRDLYKYYGERRALGPVSTEIGQGEIVGLLGLNGAGKTTGLRILACDLLPSSGTVLVDGLDVVERPDEVRARIGYLPDTPPLYNEMRVSEFLAFAAKLRGVASSDVDKRVGEVAEIADIADVAEDPIFSLSHGYRQRVGIAQAIIHDPKLVVLDEPISGLDPVQIVEMRNVVKNLGGKHTVIVSSHILSEISETCDRILVIKQGEIVASGTEAELSSRLIEGVRLKLMMRLPGEPADRATDRACQLLEGLDGVRTVGRASPTEPGDDLCAVYLEAGSDVRAQAVQSLLGAGFELLELSRQERELESVFLRLAAPAPAATATATETTSEARV